MEYKNLTIIFLVIFISTCCYLFMDSMLPHNFQYNINNEQSLEDKRFNYQISLNKNINRNPYSNMYYNDTEFFYYSAINYNYNPIEDMILIFPPPRYISHPQKKNDLKKKNAILKFACDIKWQFIGNLASSSSSNNGNNDDNDNNKDKNRVSNALHAMFGMIPVNTCGISNSFSRQF